MKKLILGFLLIGCLNIFSQDNVGIGTTSPNASAILDLTSTDKGFLLPRMTTAQRDVIASPATGLIIFNTTASRHEYNSGTPASPVWTPIISNGITSVGLSVPAGLSVSGSPLTANGTLTVTWNTQPANRVLSGPATGADASPTFRVLVSDDIPGLNTSKITAGILPVANGGTGAATLTGILKGNGTNAFAGITNTAGNITYWSDANTINGSTDMTWDNSNSILAVDGSFRHVPQGSAPVSPTAGMTYYNNTANILWLYNGSAWVDLASTGSGSLPPGTTNQMLRNTGGANWEVTNTIRATTSEIAVGSGTFTPTSVIHSDAGNAAAHYHKFTAGTTTGQTASDGFDIGINSSGLANINQKENLPLILSTNNAERMRIWEDGQIGINRTTTFDDSLKVWLEGDMMINGDLVVTGNIDPIALIFVPQNSAPNTTREGTLYYDNNSKTVKGYNGSAWSDIGSRQTSNIEILNSDNAAKEIRFYEPSSSGTNYTAVKSQAQSSDITIILPATVGSTGQVLSAADNTGTLSWANPSGGLPAGTAAQTLRYNGTTLEASGLLTNDGTIIKVNSNLEILNSDNAAKEIRFYEPSSSGTNYTAVKSQAQSSDITIILPATVGSTGQVLSAADNTGTLSWANPSGGLPAGTAAQTLRYNGTTLEASSLLTNDGTIIKVNSNLEILNSDNTAKEIRFYEPSSSGTNYTSFKAPAQAANVNTTYTLPDADGTNGQMLGTNGSGTLTWNNAVPSGTVTMFAGTTAPTGWMLCDGTAINRTTYALLFSAISTNYGIGDGTTTFNLPDLRGRYGLGKDNMGGTSANIVTASQADNLGQGSGAENHTLIVSEMPSHNHNINAANSGTSTDATDRIFGSGATYSTVTASRVMRSNTVSNTVGDFAHNNMPPYVTFNYIIKL